MLLIINALLINASLRYLARTQGTDDHWYPTDPVTQSRLDGFLHWQHLNVRSAAIQFAFEAFMNPSLKGIRPQPEILARRIKTLEDALNTVQSHWLNNGKQPFIMGDEISVADLQLSQELETMPFCGFRLQEKYPMLSDYCERLRHDLSPHYQEANVKLDAMKKRHPHGTPLNHFSLVGEYLRAKFEFM